MSYQHFCLISGFIDAWVWVIWLRVNIPSAEFNEKVQSEIISTCLVGIMTIKGKNEDPQRLRYRVSGTSFAAGLLGYFDATPANPVVCFEETVISAKKSVVQRTLLCHTLWIWGQRSESVLRESLVTAKLLWQTYIDRQCQDRDLHFGLPHPLGKRRPREVVVEMRRTKHW